MYILGVAYSVVYIVLSPTCSSLFRTIHSETHSIRKYTIYNTE